MKSGVARTDSHPPAETLALFARGDLSRAGGLKTRWHVSLCSHCRVEVEGFRDSAAALQQEAEAAALPGSELRWSRLEREMLGNIAVGVAAARCIDNVGRQRAALRVGWLITALSLLFVLGWFTHIPAEQNERLLSSLRSAFAPKPVVRMTELQSTPEGIAVKTRAATLTLMHPSSAIVALSGSSAVTARYVDEETGQVTIAKVYAQ